MTVEKIKTRPELAPLLRRLKAQGKKIGLTNGVFDLLHAGHVAYLQEAKRHCDILVVSLNTDASTRKYKGPTRPIVPLRDRQRVVAALASVDFVTSHSERRMRKTLQLLKPDLYIKGGDYAVSSLTSRGVLEAWGGRTLIVPPLRGRSSSELLRRAGEAALKEGRCLPEPERPPAPAAFLDRDGVILRDIPHLNDPRRVTLAPNAAEGLKLLAEAGYRLVVVTNQSGIGMGYLTREEFFRVNAEMLRRLHKAGILIEAVYFCPHSLAVRCSCRKPGTALLERAVEEKNLKRSESCLFGDRELDMLAARRFGIPGVLVGPGDTEKARKLASVKGCDLKEAAERYLASRRAKL